MGRFLVARVAAVGVSTRPVCGVRDHALLLAEALAREEVPCSLHWLSGGERSLRTAGSQVRAWTGELATELSDGGADAVLWHYSVFAHSHRGVPLFVHPTVAALRRSHIPVIAVMHELVYPWRRGGLRGGAWAVSQRAALIEVMRACAAVIVTADFRAEWLASRPWLPRRPTAVAPVFSNLPRSEVQPPADRDAPLVGLFGYSLDPATIALVADALRMLWDRGVQPRLTLLGAPGARSGIADAWRRATESRGVASALSFSGTLPPQELADALAACDVLLYADMMGPAARKGTLAASLASARPVLAMEGRRRWEEFLDSGAARVVPRTHPALADALQALLADRSEIGQHARESLGARGRAFYERTMGVSRTAAAVRELLAQALAGEDVQGRSERSKRQLEHATR
jgi:glycosyltransferase involved in cell wall biosynthesis